LFQETEGIWESQDWWPIYTKGIELVRILLQKHKYCFLEDAIFFIGVHEEYLMDSLLLAKQALDKNAIALIRQTLELICEVSLYGREWRMEHGQSVMNLIKCIQILTEHLITLLFCPKILKRLIDGPNVALDDFRDQAIVDASDELVPVMNE
jgi:nuclear pore complex protein Nup188